MSEPGTPSHSGTHPDLSALLRNYLEQIAGRPAFAQNSSRADVVPFQATPAQALDTHLAWSEALEVLGFFGPMPKLGDAIPDEWVDLVRSREPMLSIAFCVANFPQLLRDLAPLLQENPARHMARPAAEADERTGLETWIRERLARREPAHACLGLGLLRLAGRFDAAESWRAEHATVPWGAWQGAWENESAALDWHRGNHASAEHQWGQQKASVPVHFNRGMAALFLGKPAQASDHLQTAVRGLSENSAWHHLAALYLTLADASA